MTGVSVSHVCADCVGDDKFKGHKKICLDVAVAPTPAPTLKSNSASLVVVLVAFDTQAATLSVAQACVVVVIRVVGGEAIARRARRSIVGCDILFAFGLSLCNHPLVRQRQRRLPT